MILVFFTLIKWTYEWATSKRWTRKE